MAARSAAGGGLTAGVKKTLSACPCFSNIHTMSSKSSCMHHLLPSTAISINCCDYSNTKKPRADLLGIKVVFLVPAPDGLPYIGVCLLGAPFAGAALGL